MDGEAVRAYRKKRGVTQEGLADLLNKALDRRYDKARISRWENGSEPIPDPVAAYLGRGTSLSARIIAIANQKGGVGKTTTTVNLAAALARAERRVLVIDADPQGNASVLAGVDLHKAVGEGHTLFPLLKAEDPDTLPDLANRTIQESEGFDIIPGSIDLAEFEAMSPTIPAANKRLKYLVGLLRQNYDYILIDCPPNLGTMTLSAMIAATEVLIPVATAPLDVLGVTLLLKTIKQMRMFENPDLEVAGILPTKHDERNSVERAVLKGLQSDYKGKVRVFEPIRRATGFDQAAWNGVVAVRALPNDHPAHAYITLAAEVLGDEVKA